MNIENAWTRDDIVVSSLEFLDLFRFISNFWLYFFWFWSIFLNGMLPRILWHIVGWDQAQFLDSLEFEQRGFSIWIFVATWDRDTFRWVAVPILHQFSIYAFRQLSVLG